MSIQRLASVTIAVLFLASCGDLLDETRQAVPEAHSAGVKLLTHLAQRDLDGALQMVDPVARQTITRSTLEQAALLVPTDLNAAETAGNYKINKTVNAATETTDLDAALRYQFKCEERTCLAEFNFTRKAGVFYLNQIRVGHAVRKHN
jgi:hypothetical protein